MDPAARQSISTTLVQRLRRRFAAADRPVAGCGALGRFMAAQAAFIAQKCTIEYCRARSGLMWERLFRETAFREALEVSRWEAYAAVLVDVAVVVEGHLRPHAGAAAEAVTTALGELVAAGLAEYPVPAYRQAAGWGDVVAAAEGRLAAARLAPPRSAHEIGFVAGARVFDTLPIHPRLRGHDRELIVNNIRFGLCRFDETLRARLRPEAVIREIAGREPGAPPAG